MSETALKGSFLSPKAAYAHSSFSLLLQRFGAVLEALEKGQLVDLSAMPPAPEGECEDGLGEPGQGGAGQASHLHFCSGSSRPEALPTGF